MEPQPDARNREILTHHSCLILLAIQRCYPIRQSWGCTWNLALRFNRNQTNAILVCMQVMPNNPIYPDCIMKLSTSHCSNALLLIDRLWVSVNTEHACALPLPPLSPSLPLSPPPLLSLPLSLLSPILSLSLSKVNRSKLTNFMEFQPCIN